MKERNIYYNSKMLTYNAFLINKNREYPLKYSNMNKLNKIIHKLLLNWYKLLSLNLFNEQVKRDKALSVFDETK